MSSLHKENCGGDKSVCKMIVNAVDFSQAMPIHDTYEEEVVAETLAQEKSLKKMRLSFFNSIKIFQV